MYLPTPERLAHSTQLANLIKQRIAQHGKISFAEYMQLALYAPTLGYYSAGQAKLGQTGDFITAPLLTPLFGYTLANYIAPLLSHYPAILEFGAGTGQMACDILQHLGTLQKLPVDYYILEVSADLRARQHALFAAHCPQHLDRIHWLDTIPTAFNGIVLANEVLDAMPVHLFTWQDDILYERYVRLEEDAFAWDDDIPSTPLLAEYLAPFLPHLPQPYVSEVNLAAAGWLIHLAEKLHTAQIILIDYGFDEKTFYHPERYQGTLMCHYQHRAHTDPFLYPGLQDITAHINFSHLATVAAAHQLQLQTYSTQADFLTTHGILNLSEHISPQRSTRINTSQALKQLLFPTEMGELFKVMVLKK